MSAVRQIGGVLLAVAALSVEALGQVPRTTVVGVVRDSAGRPVALAHVITTGSESLSDSAGRFSMPNVPVGKTSVSIRRLGYEPTDLVLEAVEGRVDSLIVVLTVLPVDLPGVVTHADERLRVYLAEFYRHRENGMGRYLDRAQLSAMRVSQTSDVLRRMPGVRLVPDRNGRYVLRMGRSGGRNCSADFWIDGVRAPFLNVDDVPLSDIEALEVYNGPGALPPEYNNRTGNPTCGVVVIWTRMPG